jgi:HD-like signal output (HDOD) protein
MAGINTIDISEVRGQERRDVLISEVNKLISLPDIYYRLESAIESPNATVDDFSLLLSTDTDLCARLLRMANSAFYSFPAKIETIDRAIGTIGFRQIRELVLMTSVIEAFNGVPIDQVNMRTFWEHSVAVGVLARAMALHAGLAQSDRFYIPGLLHDIGRLVLYLQLPGLMAEIVPLAKSLEKRLYQYELEHLEYTHAEVGGRLLEMWKVPQSIFEPVFYHHQPLQASEFIQMTSAVHIADAWVNGEKFGTSGELGTPVIQPEAFQIMGIQLHELDEIWTKAKEEITDIVNQFLSN